MSKLGGKLRNDYAGVLDLERIPKQVVAAIAVALICRLEGCIPDDGPIIRDEFVKEWRALHAAGIVPQKPPGGLT
jgi:hypothetical protein